MLLKPRLSVERDGIQKPHRSYERWGFRLLNP
jgi:hypothetical protein